MLTHYVCDLYKSKEADEYQTYVKNAEEEKKEFVCDDDFLKKHNIEKTEYTPMK